MADTDAGKTAGSKSPQRECAARIDTTISTARIDGFLPLRGYAVIGDGRSCALVGADGAVDWWTLPAMHSPPSFGAVLAPGVGGRFTLAPVGAFEVSRRYVKGGGVLETVFRTASGSVAVTDALTMADGALLGWSELARRVRGLEGEVRMSWEVTPGDRFTGTAPWAHQHDGRALIDSSGQRFALVCDGVGDPEEHGGGFRGSFTARPDQPRLLAVVATDDEPTPVPTPAAVQRRIEDTTAYWGRWCERVSYDGRWRHAVLRSAVVLSQLTFKPTGALQAAATTSLPEALGGSRNMDYRFCWVRDSGFALTALTGLRLHPEVHATMSFLLRALRASAPDVPPFYSMYGEPVSPVMQSVSGWTGYRCSSPVQRGNHASDQRQLGSYGDALEAISRYVAHGNKLDGASGRLVAQMAEQVCRQWREPDAGLWELSQTRPYTSSKIGCWAALTRAAELADAGQVPAEGAPRWRLSADQIRRYINQTCWSSGKGSYTFYAGGNELDAATLLVARTGFCSADDPRLHRTIEAIRRELSAGGPLLYRYSGMAEKEGAFLACTFWLVEALVHAGRLDEAGALMDAAVEQANDVGLLSEEIDPASRELLGNMPQALSHLALINAAIRFTAAT